MTTIPTGWTEQLSIPGLDGYTADRIALNFTGAVDLDRLSEDDLNFIETLTLGSQVTLKVNAVVTKKGFTLTTGREDQPDTTGYGVSVKVHTIELT